MKPIFRTAMFGFNRDDVTSFISHLSKQNEKRIGDLAEEHKSIEEDYRSQLDAARVDSEALSGLKESIEKSKDSFDKIRLLSDRISTRRDQFLESLEKGTNCADRMGTDIINLQDRLLQLEKYREKAEKFDRLAGVLSEIISGDDVSNPSSASNEPLYSAADPQEALRILQKMHDEALVLSDLYEELLNLLDSIQIDL